MGAMILAIRPAMEESLTRFNPSEKSPGPKVGQLEVQSWVVRGLVQGGVGRVWSRAWYYKVEMKVENLTTVPRY